LQRLFDQDLIVARKRRAVAQAVPGAAFLAKRVAEDLADRLSAVERRFADAAALHCFTPHAAEALARSGKVDRVTRIEADPVLLAGGEGLVAAPDRVPLAPASADLVVSLLSLHEANDVPGQLVQIRRALRPDGLFLGAMAGGGTLAELRDSLLAAETEVSGGAAPRVMPFADVDTITVRYDSMFGLLRDLRAMGATSALAERPRRPATRTLFRRAAEHYAGRHADRDGRVRATFSIVWLSGWAPHESQQKPLRPGSATASLKDFLEGGG
jgi:SAM-dependent methyltransferase